MRRASGASIRLNRALVLQMAKFAIAGIANTLFSLLIYWLLLTIVPAQAAYAASYAAGIALSYALSTRFVFKVNHTWKRFFLFPMIYFISYLAGAIVLFVAVDKLTVATWLAPFLSISITLPLTFALSRLLMRDSKPADDVGL